MEELLSREIRLKRRPSGMPDPDCFEMAETPVPEPKPGELVVRNTWMSVDPYMRLRMWDRPSYMAPYELGKPLDGGCIGQVVRSSSDNFAPGDLVLGMCGWRDYWVSDGQGVVKIAPGLGPVETFLGPLGMPGMTAYVGLLRIGELQEGERVFVTAAAGAVGSLVCQMAKAKGCYVVGSAGSEEKIAWLLGQADLDHAFNYKQAADLAAELGNSFPAGIDVYFDNVGGDHLDAALQHMNRFGRIVACGMVSQYNEPTPPPGPRYLARIVMQRLKMQGFIVSDHAELREQFLTEMAHWMAAGKIKWRQTVVDGLEHAPQALIGLLQGENMGKMLVRIAPEPVVYL